MQEPIEPKPTHTNRALGFILLLFIIVNTFIGLVIASSDSNAMQISGVIVQLITGVIAGAAMIQLSRK